jgi:hypothetical protein
MIEMMPAQAELPKEVVDTIVNANDIIDQAIANQQEAKRNSNVKTIPVKTSAGEVTLHIKRTLSFPSKSETRLDFIIDWGKEDPKEEVALVRQVDETGQDTIYWGYKRKQDHQVHEHEAGYASKNVSDGMQPFAYSLYVGKVGYDTPIEEIYPSTLTSGMPGDTQLAIGRMNTVINVCVFAENTFFPSPAAC